MNFLFLTHNFPPKVGGIADLTYSHVSELSKKHRVVVYNFLPRKEKFKKIKKERTENFLIYRFPQTILNRIYFILRYPFILLKEKTAFVINVDEDFSFPSLYNFIVAKLLGKKTIVFIHGTQLLYKSKVKINLLLSLADKIISNSNFTASLIPQFNKKITIVNPPINPKKFDLNLSKTKTNAKKILFVGILSRGKGLDDLLKALQIVLKKIDAELIVVGEGPSKPFYKSIAKELRLEKKAKFVGKCSNEKLSEFYSGCDVLVLPSKRIIKGETNFEGFGIVLLEAGLFKKPVIATAFGGIPEAVEDGKTGLLVEQNNSQELADAIIKVLGNEKLAKTLGENGFKRAAEFFPEKKAAQFLKAII